jgi:hypothetical protein
MNSFQYQTIEGSELVLTDKAYNYLGPELVVKESRIVLRVDARNLTITDARFVNCTIEAKHRLVNCQEWCCALLQNCRFSGTYIGNDFGHWPEGFGEFGGLEHCDFSDAILDGCRLMDSDVKNIVFPRWPCFTILDPLQRLEELATRFPVELDSWVHSLSNSSARTVAVTSYAPGFLKKYGVSERNVRTAIEGLEGVRF